MRTGRPRGFDRDEALDKAMRLFWRHGFEGVTLSQLTREMGVAPPSLYAAFGSKADLYREALDRYTGLPTSIDLDAVGEASGLREAARLFLTMAIATVIAPDRELGCMLTTGMVSSHPDNADLAEHLASRRAALKASIAARLGHLVQPSRAEAFAGYLLAILQGLSIQARDGAGADELWQIAEQAMAGLRDYPLK